MPTKTPTSKADRGLKFLLYSLTLLYSLLCNRKRNTNFGWATVDFFDNHWTTATRWTTSIGRGESVCSCFRERYNAVITWYCIALPIFPNYTSVIAW